MTKQKFQIRYGLGGGFGGCRHNEWEDCDADTEDEAGLEAWEAAKDEYESYVGLHGLRDYGQIMEEDGVDEEEAEEIYIEEMEGWLDYEIRVKPE